MPIVIGIIVVLLMLFAILIMIQPKSSVVHIEHTKIKRWVEHHRDTLPLKHHNALDDNIRRLNDALNSRRQHHHMFQSSCCRREVNDAYEALIETFVEAYTAMNKNATRRDALDALEHYVDPRFSVNDAVYIERFDFTGSITAVNDDLTYTVCNPAEDCQRVFEWEIEPLHNTE